MIDLPTLLAAFAALTLLVYAIHVSNHWDLPRRGMINAQWVQRLRSDYWERRYKTKARHVSMVIDSQSKLQRAASDTQSIFQRSFSSDLLGQALLLAFALPTVLLVGQQGAEMLGRQGAERLNDLARNWLIYGPITSLGLMLLARKLSNRIVKGILIVFSVLIAQILAAAMASTGDAALSTMTSIVVLALAVAIGARVNSGIVATTTAGALTILVIATHLAMPFAILAGIVALFLGLVFGGGSNGALEGALVTGFGGTFALGLMLAAGGAAVFSSAQFYLGKAIQRPATVLLGFTCLLLASLTYSTMHFSWGEQAAELSVTLIAFLGIIPLVLGLALFAAAGMARLTYRLGAARGASPLLWALLSLAFSIAVIRILGCALIAFFYFVETPTVPLADLEEMFWNVRSWMDPSTPNADGPYWWLVTIFIVPVIPSVLQLLLCWRGIALRVSPWFRNMLARELEASAYGETWRGRWAVHWLSAAKAISVVVPVLAATFLWMYAPTLGLFLLDTFAGFAHWLGAL